jgi:hypothetical protein
VWRVSAEQTAEAYAVGLAYQLGFAAGEHALATRCEALEGAWKPYKAPTWEDQVAARVVVFSDSAKESGRPEWVGLDNGATLPVWSEDYEVAV